MFRVVIHRLVFLLPDFPHGVRQRTSDSVPAPKAPFERRSLWRYESSIDNDLRPVGKIYQYNLLLRSQISIYGHYRRKYRPHLLQFRNLRETFLFRHQKQRAWSALENRRIADG